MPAERVTSLSPWHVVFVIDDSWSMSTSGAAKNVNAAMEQLISDMQLLSQGMKPYFKLSVISFGSDSKVLATLQNEMQIDTNVVANFQGTSGSTNAAAALTEAYNILANNGGSERDFEPFVFFLSDGSPDNQQLALDAGQKIKSMSVPAGTPRLVTLGFGATNDLFMRDLASNPELYKKLQTSSDITSVLPAVGTMTGKAPGADGVAQAIMHM